MWIYERTLIKLAFIITIHLFAFDTAFCSLIIHDDDVLLYLGEDSIEYGDSPLKGSPVEVLLKENKENPSFPKGPYVTKWIIRNGLLYFESLRDKNNKIIPLLKNTSQNNGCIHAVWFTGDISFPRIPVPYFHFLYDIPYRYCYWINLHFNRGELISRTYSIDSFLKCLAANSISIICSAIILVLFFRGLYLKKIKKYPFTQAYWCLRFGLIAVLLVFMIIYWDISVLIDKSIDSSSVEKIVILIQISDSIKCLFISCVIAFAGVIANIILCWRKRGRPHALD